MGILEGLWLSFLQSFTEFLPVSSSGHLLFFKNIINHHDIPLIMDILLHTGSLVAVILYFRGSIRQTFSKALHEIRHWPEEKTHSKFVAYVLISTLVTFTGYLVFKGPIEARIQTPAVLKYTYLITTLVLLATIWNRHSHNQLITRKGILFAVIVGAIQIIAILPGVSRSGMTISIMLLLGVERSEAAYYSFMLFIPAALGAFLFKIFNVSNLQFLQANWLPLLISLLSTILLSALFLSLLTWIVRRGRMYLFSVYTLGMAVLAWILF